MGNFEIYSTPKSRKQFAAFLLEKE